MWIADKWNDYELLDCGGGEKLERWDKQYLVRPDPQVLWNTPKKLRAWKHMNGHYHRSNKGGGEWEFFDLPEEWSIHCSLPIHKELTFHLKPFSFKHTGLFPEQAVNWDWMINKIKEEKKITGREIKVLNLFAYTGGASVACSYAGASVCHVDSSKGMTTWAKENVESSGLRERPVRFIVDDVVKFVQREIRRGNKYDAIIMDPPSYGRGANGEVWDIEKNLNYLVSICSEILTDEPLFFLINSYTTGISSQVLENILRMNFEKSCKAKGKFENGETPED